MKVELWWLLYVASSKGLVSATDSKQPHNRHSFPTYTGRNSTFSTFSTRTLLPSLGSSSSTSLAFTHTSVTTSAAISSIFVPSTSSETLHNSSTTTATINNATTTTTSQSEYSSKSHQSRPQHSRSRKSKTVTSSPNFSVNSTTAFTTQTQNHTHTRPSRTIPVTLTKPTLPSSCHGKGKGKDSHCPTSEEHHAITTAVVWGNTPTGPCTPISEGGTMTLFSVVYTSTVTFHGNRSDYKPPHPQITTPYYCTGSTNTGDGPLRSGIYQTEASISPEIVVFTTSGRLQTTTISHVVYPTVHVQKPIITFITTDKNPSVVFPSDAPPSYTQTWGNNLPGNQGGHETKVPGTGSIGNPNSSRPRPTYTITAGPTSVVINHSTFTGGKQTTIVTVGTGLFTINPTAVIGEGASVGRTRQPQPTTEVVGGVPLTAAGSSIVIGGQTLTMPPIATTTLINGHTVTYGPGGVTINGQIFRSHASLPTDVVVVGGEMLTAAGRSIAIIHSTTITYGPGLPDVVKVVRGDTVAIEPTGVVVHNSTLGGPNAIATQTEYEIIGGATIGKLPPSQVVVNGHTYPVGPGAELKTVIAGNERITLGPIGLVMASTTMSFPFDAAIVTTFSPSQTDLDEPWPADGASDDENQGDTLAPNSRLGFFCLCIAFGVWVAA